jgi:hypothetical protein
MSKNTFWCDHQNKRTKRMSKTAILIVMDYYRLKSGEGRYTWSRVQEHLKVEISVVLSPWSHGQH